MYVRSLTLPFVLIPSSSKASSTTKKLQSPAHTGTLTWIPVKYMTSTCLPVTEGVIPSPLQDLRQCGGPMPPLFSFLLPSVRPSFLLSYVVCGVSPIHPLLLFHPNLSPHYRESEVLQSVPPKQKCTPQYRASLGSGSVPPLRW